MNTESRIYVPGTFDMLHWGHIELFKKAREMGRVIVSLNRDKFVERFKRKPVMSFEERWRALEGCKYVDEVMTNFGDEDSKIAILASRATHIVHGNDWIGDSYYKQMGFTQEWLDENYIKMIFLPYTAEISTTQIIKRCLAYQ